MSARMHRITLSLASAALATALSWAGPLSAQDTPQDTPRGRAQSTLPAEVFSQIDAAAQAAAQEGIPGDILFNKALEGAAKRVPADRLLPAVQEYAGRLRQAHGAFGPGAQGPLLVAGADALQRGVGPELLEGLGRSPDRSPMACLVLADLVETGIGGDHALSLVREALQRRAREQQMLDMPAQLRRLMRQGQSAQDAVEQVRRGLRGQRGGGMTPPVAPGAEPMTRTRGGG
jgi:hypothetical protein